MGSEVTNHRDATLRSVRIALSMTPEQRALLRRAADAACMPVSAFVLRSACQAAEYLLKDQPPETAGTGVGSLPTLTRPARQRWESIPAPIRQRLLSNVWCGRCGHEVTIADISGTMKGRDLMLVGRCADCRGEVARVIEGA